MESQILRTIPIWNYSRGSCPGTPKKHCRKFSLQLFSGLSDLCWGLPPIYLPENPYLAVRTCIYILQFLGLICQETLKSCKWPHLKQILFHFTGIQKHIAFTALGIPGNTDSYHVFKSNASKISYIFL